MASKKRPLSRPPKIPISERNVVVHTAGLEGRRVGPWTLSTTAAIIVVAHAPETGIATTIAAPGAIAVTAAIEQRQVRVEALQHHFGGILVGARLVLPLARLQLAF